MKRPTRLGISDRRGLTSPIGLSPLFPHPAILTPIPSGICLQQLTYWRLGDVSNSEQNAGQPEEHTNSGRRNTRMRSHVSPRSCIVILDDEPVIASSLAAILQMNGFSARFFTSPLEALAAARSESPHLVKAREHRKDCGRPSLPGGGLLD
jgi:hypothetical protein